MEKEWLTLWSPPPPKEITSDEVAAIRKAVDGNPAVIIGRQGCFMIIVIMKLVLMLGAYPVVSEIASNVAADEKALIEELVGEVVDDEALALPVLVIGGKTVGSVDKVIGAHLSGQLVPKLKEAGACLALSLT